MMKKILVSIIVISSIFGPLLAYETGKNPKKSALYSFFIPGGGQFYNEAYGKSIFWGGAELGFIALTSYHQSKFNDYKDKRSQASNQEDWDKWNKKAGDQLHKRNNGFWWLGSTVILSMMDAYVDASLFNYEEEKGKLNLQFDLNYIGFEVKF